MDTKSEIFKAWGKQNLENEEQQKKLTVYEGRLEKTIADAQYWLTNYADSFKKHDKNMNGLREEISGRMDNLH